MDDKFIYGFRQEPDSRFASQLRLKLHSLNQEKTPGFWYARWKLGLAAVITVIVLGSLTAIKPIRAFVASVLTDIGGQSFEVTSDYPGNNGTGEEVTIYPEIMTLEEALAVFPYTIHLPTGMPPETVLNEEEVRVYVGEDAGSFANTIEIEWRGEAPGGTGYYTLRISDSQGEIIAPYFATEIALDDQHTAVLIQGGWNYDQKTWANDSDYRLKWTLDDLIYDLHGAHPDILVEIARSTLP